MQTPSEPSPRCGFAQRRPARLVRPAVAVFLALAMLACVSDDDDAVLVLAAASTIDAMESAVAGFRAVEPARVEVSFASTSVLARQIEEGAPADLMLSASVDWADYVQQRVAVERRVVLVRNQLTVVGPAGSKPLQSLAQVDDQERFASIAIADPTSVPAGMYAAEALHRAGLWEAIEARLVPTVDVRAALRLVADGEADAGFVYATDAAASARVRIIARVDPQLHEPIEYPLLLLGGARPEAVRFFDYLISEPGRAHFRDRGFVEADR